ncbi:conserved hypothetical protein [Hyphomicrobiales bacterium]|nr:conserved hypothetical protein [Hyphomicrobiales bacterium]CAH1699604.1 conserved hypothetical protein [Hyphomicrobiales bacterium]CAI0343355.1 conserved hypothetical protein [Hyphomicrobiales bacterium]
MKSMTHARQTPEANVQNVADRLIEMIDRASNTQQAAEMLDEVSHLLWLASSLDPEAESQIGRSRYVSQAPRDEI